MVSKRTQGFTIVEVAVSIAILAVVSVMVLPALSRPLGNVKIQTDARKLSSLLRLARQQAITSGQPKTVVFYPDNARYKINGQSTYYLSDGIDFAGTTTFTARVGGLPACGFSPSGSPSSGGTVTLSNGNRYIYVIVNPVAGRIRISETPPEGWD